MEFAWTAEQEDYRERVKGALEELLPPNWYTKYAPQGYGSDDQIDFSREFCPKLADRGLLVPHWPAEHGGDDREPWDQFILAEEVTAAGEPRGPQYMNVNWIGPTLMKFGTPEQQAKHLGPISRGEVIWCQGYSEPGAGTDLAALKTKAERVGDKYVVNGSKIWTSYARKADWCFLLARTGPERKAISIFLVPMSTPGIKVTSFPGLVQNGHLNEVFFTDVEVPVENRVGEESMAWPIITHALSFERVGVPRYFHGLELMNVAAELLKREGRFNDPIVRSRAAKVVAKFEAAKWLTYLVVDQRAKQSPPTADGNIARISAAEAVCDLMNFCMDYLPDILLEGDAMLADFYRANISGTIAAGTYEIQLNLIAQNALGLPRT